MGTGIDVHAHLLVAGRALCAPELGVCPTLTMAGIAERQAALWLASDEAKNVNGAVIEVSGGMTV